MALQAVVMWFTPSIPLIGTLFGAYAMIPQSVSVLAAIAAGGLAGWLGWRAGGVSTRRAAAPA